MGKKKKMLFRKLGGKYQLRIDSPEDLKAVCHLDDALWICTSAPVESFTCDKAFLKYLDSDANGRIRTDEVKAAVAWLFSILSDFSAFHSDSDDFPLDAINIDSKEGKQLRTAAERVLSNLGIADKKTIKIEHTRSRQDILASGECNGDGVIPATALDDKDLRELVQDIMSTIGEASDASGTKGIKVEHLDTFLKDAAAYIEWFDKGNPDNPEKTTPVMVWGAKTPDAYRALYAVKDKIDEYFSQCMLLEVEKNAELCFNLAADKIISLDVSDTKLLMEHIERAPLACPIQEKILYFDDKINPLYADKIRVLRNSLIKHSDKLENKNQLTYEEWEKIKAEFALYAEWEAGKPVEKVDSLGIQKLRSYLEGDLPERLRPFFEKDLAVADEIKQIGEVEKLLLFSKYLLEFTNNFVSLASLFDPSGFSMIQVGKLVMDARHYDLNVKVRDIATHKKTAVKSNICVMYLKLTSKRDGKEYTENIATAVTSGNIQNLYIGKMGVFFTPDGKEWDAQIVDFMKQPVSISEALKMPFTKLADFIKKRTEKFTSSTYAKVEANVGTSLNSIQSKITAPAKTAQNAKTSSTWNMPLMLLGGGIGIAGLGSAFASLMNALKDNTVLLKIGIFILALMLLIAVPIIISAILKLKRRNIGMFLEAGGWSINSAMRMTLRMGLLFSRTPAYPENSEKQRCDYTSSLLKKITFQKEKSWGGIVVTLLLIVLLCSAGFLLFSYYNLKSSAGNSGITHKKSVQKNEKTADCAKTPAAPKQKK